MKQTLLVIDDEKDIRNLLARTLELEGYVVETAQDAKSGLKTLSRQEIYVVIADVKLPDMHGLSLVADIKEHYPETEVICLTAFGNIQDGVQAMKNGAFDYLVKGDDNPKIIPLVAKAAEKAALQLRLKHFQEKAKRPYGFEQIIGHSKAVQQVIAMAQKVSQTDTTVLLTGPTGTGKEVFAHAIHYEGHRKAEPFMAVNCSAFGKDLLESEMYGHKAGAFTGAVKDKKGLLEEAHRGTLFLDEIGEMPLDLQAKLLRVLESGTFIKVGDTKETEVDVRIIAATNKNLEEESEKGNFREDLYYRLSVFQISMPALAERKEDIPLLAAYFLKQFSLKQKKKVAGMTEDYLEALRQHTWRGNIRELRNVIERSVILCDTDRLTIELLPFDFLSPKNTGIQTGIFRLKDLEKQHIRQVLAYAQGNKTKAAELLDIGLTTLYQKIKDYNL